MAQTRRKSRRGPREAPEPPDSAAALEIAVRFLGTRPRTRWELERRLQRAGASADVTEVTLERLAAMGYLDDVAFAAWWTDQRDRHAPRGRRMIEAELRQRGVPRDVIAARVETGEVGERAPDDEALPATEEERARIALERHLRGRPIPTQPAELRRIGMFLVRRGFDPETVRATIREAGHSEPEGS